MFSSYIKIALRSAVRQKLYSLINILGLTVGVAACIVILLYVRDQLSYDRWNSKADRIYRVATHSMSGATGYHVALSSAPLAATLLEEFPEVEAVTRIRYIGGYPVIRYGDKAFSEERAPMADSTIFDVFDIELIRGNPRTALTKPNSMVISESTARRYFGDEDPMGQIMTSDRVRERIVTGVYKDIPRNSHFHYDFIVSFATDSRSRSTVWSSNGLYTYVVLKEGTDPREVDAKLAGLVEKYIGPEMGLQIGMSWEQMQEGGSSYRIYLQPLTDIHLRSNLGREIEVNGNATYVTIFALTAVFILLIACINFMNLTTARFAGRAREVGIRKTVGSHRQQLVLQFLTESVLFTLIAVVLAIALVQLILPWFNSLVGLQLSFSYTDLPYVIAGAVVVGILAGSYPAFFLSSFHPVDVIKGTFIGGSHRSRLRSALVIFQFTISIFLLIGTMIVKKQLDFLQARDLGYDPDNLLIVEKTDDIGGSIDAFKLELAEHSSILEVSNSNPIPGQPVPSQGSFGVDPPSGARKTQLLNVYYVDYNFLNTYGLEMAAGRFFSPEFTTDSVSVVINQATANALGFDDHTGRNLLTFVGEGCSFPIIGIVKDFHYQSLHSKIEPLVLYPFELGPWGGSGSSVGKFTSLRIRPDNIPELMGYVDSTWMNHALDQAFEYVYFDDLFNDLYREEQRTSIIADIFAALAIFVACLGLLGLASFTAEQRTKEVGIRKVLGASAAGIFTLLSSNIVKLVVISAALSLPISYYAMQHWLQDFAYRISYSLLTFALAALIALVIAVLTVGWQALKAATSDPVKALRYE
ncbi:ABC transporter permease [Candidatus Neomarinimicrobiota bacterium]